MNFIRFFDLVSSGQKYFNVLDWIMGTAALSWGLWQHSAWWIAGGIIGLALAWWNPTRHIRNYFSLVKKKNDQ